MSTYLQKHSLFEIQGVKSCAKNLLFFLISQKKYELFSLNFLGGLWAVDFWIKTYFQWYYMFFDYYLFKSLLSTPGIQISPCLVGLYIISLVGGNTTVETNRTHHFAHYRLQKPVDDTVGWGLFESAVAALENYKNSVSLIHLLIEIVPK